MTDPPAPPDAPPAPAGPGEAAAPPRAPGGWVGWIERRINLTEIFSFITHFGLVYTPIDTTRGFREAVRDVGRQPVPTYARWPRVLGLLAAILFMLEAATGVLLAYYYRPTPEAAFESTRTIVRDLPAGWFIHQMHAWGAWLLVAVVIARMVRLFWDELYRAPRELLWWSAVALVWIVLQLDFSGRLLTWDAHSYWSTVRGLEVVWALPVVGPVLAFLLGGRVVNDDVLIRFYVLHLLVLPLVYVGLLYVTSATLRRVGTSPDPHTGTARVTTFRDHVYSMLMLAVFLFAVLVTLATLLPFAFRTEADPYSTPSGVRPPWYMLASYAVLHGLPLPTWISGTLLVIVAFANLLPPLLGRDEPPGGKTSRRVRIAGLVALAVWAALTVAGYLLDRRMRG